MDNGSVLQARDLRPPWGLAAAAAGCVAVGLTPPLSMLVVAPVLVDSL